MVPTVNLTRSDWDTIITVLTMARDNGTVFYIDSLINELDNQVYAQEY